MVLIFIKEIRINFENSLAAPGALAQRQKIYDGFVWGPHIGRRVYPRLLAAPNNFH